MPIKHNRFSPKKIAPSNSLFDMDFCEVIANSIRESTEASAEVKSNASQFFAQIHSQAT